MEDFDNTRLMPLLTDAQARFDAADAIAAQSRAAPITPNILPLRRSVTCLLRLLQTDHSATTQPNPVMAAATPLLLVLAALYDDTTPAPGPGFEHLLIRAVHQFDQQAISRGVSSDCVNAARYILCTTLDEAILAKAWAQSWSQHSLLQRFHNETHGGDRFFQLLENLLQRQTQYADLLQLCHYCLNVGFSGRLQLDRNGQYHKEALCSQICHVLQRHHAAPTLEALLIKAPRSNRHSGTGPLNLRRHVLVLLLVWCCLFTGLRLWLAVSATSASAGFMLPPKSSMPTTEKWQP